LDIHQFLTDVSVDAGVDLTGGSASFTLAIPIHHHQSMARDARMVLRAGLEVHIYERGYFPVKGLYSNLEQPAGNQAVGTNPDLAPGFSSVGQGDPYRDVPPVVGEAFNDLRLQDGVKSTATGQPFNQRENATVLYNTLTDAGYAPSTAMAAVINSWYECNLDLNNPNVSSHASGYIHIMPDWNIPGYNSTEPAESAQAVVRYLRWKKFPSGQSNSTVASETKRFSIRAEAPGKATSAMKPGERQSWNIPTDADWTVSQVNVWIGDQRSGWASKRMGSLASDKGFNAQASAERQQQDAAAEAQAKLESTKPSGDRRDAGLLGSPTLSDQEGLGGYDIENILAYPYYHVFHGVVTSVAMVYDAGFQTFTCQCISMLQLWQYLPVSVNASIFGARAVNSKNHPSIMGHNFTGMHPYAIIYRLYEDLAGAGAGVSWALSQMTTTDASFAGESLWSIFQRYWERRFSTSMIKLRLHGATGELFNTFYATLLGRGASAADLTNALKGRFGAIKGDPSAQIFSKGLGASMINPKRLDALVVNKGLGANAEGVNAKGSDGDFDLNMAEMIAFTTKLGHMGQFQMFESTYETKGNVAQEVCRVTGFEFYQDVDGDFVFKPPFYNLDTSSARVYRIEDIDIISLQMDEKEPQATYIVGKGNWFQNLEGHGVENEMGVQTTYIDYRLVAQFGWRAASFECQYLTDPKSVMFMSINFMDVQNAQIHSGSLTIPIRPEMRPGYPVYIVPLDCYYYVTNIVHAYIPGGRCTSTLTLTAKRSKFFAPGDYRKSGVEAIDLGNPILPEKPLEVLDEAGRPRLVGFPNVVMALDPYQINPLFLVLGADIDLLNTPQKVVNLIEMAIQFRVLTANPDGTYTFTTSAGKKMVFFFDANQLSVTGEGTKDEKWTTSGAGPSGTYPLMEAANAWAAAMGQHAEAKDKARKDLLALEAKIATLQAELRTAQARGNDKALKVIQKNINSVVDNRVSLKKTIETPDTDVSLAGSNEGLAALLQVMNELGAKYRPESGQPGSRDLASTTVLLDILSDKKASISTVDVPGAYRYYSASHPDPNQQGQAEPNFDGWANARSKTIEYNNPLLLPEWTKDPVKGFVPSNRITLSPGSKYRPEAQFGDLQPTRGIRILTHNPAFPNGEVVPTSEIRDFTWASHDLKVPMKGNSAKKEIQASDTGALPNLRGGMQQTLRVQAQEVTDLATIQGTFAPWLKGFNDQIQNAIVAMQADPVLAPYVQPFPTMIDPNYVVIRRFSFPTNDPMGDYKFADTNGTLTSFFNADSVALKGSTGTTVWMMAADEYADAIYSQYIRAKNSWMGDLMTRFTGSEDIEKMNQINSLFTEAVTSNLGKAIPRDWSDVSKTSATAKPISSPIFPVSDAQGYEVVGSLRYGRDITIEPDGVFDTLHKQDPLSMLDQALVVKVLEQLTRRQGIDAETQHNVVRSLRSGMTDNQLIDIGLLTQNRDSNMLQLDFMNWWTNHGKDGIQKIPVNNAAYSLADLNLIMNKGVCTCKSAEASIVLEAAGMTGFVRVASPTDATPNQGTTADNVTPWLQYAADQAGLQWKMSQDALRGAQLNKQPATIVQSAQGLVDGSAFATAEAQAQQAKNDLWAANEARKTAGKEFWAANEARKTAGKE